MKQSRSTKLQIQLLDCNSSIAGEEAKLFLLLWFMCWAPLAKGSLKILIILTVLMDLALPTTESHPPLWRRRPFSHRVYLPLQFPQVIHEQEQQSS